MMSASSYSAPGFRAPRPEQLPVPVLAADDANGQRIAIAATATAEYTTALPQGCDLALVTNLGSNVVHVRADGSAATNASMPILGGSQREVLVTAADRRLSLYGTAADVIVVTPFKSA